MSLFILNNPVFCQKAWEPFVSYEGRFKINAPAGLKHNVQEVETELGQLEFHTYYYHADKYSNEHGEMYMVQYCDYPLYTLSSDSIELVEQFLLETIESSAGSIDGEVVYQTTHFINGFPGKQWKTVYNDGATSIRHLAVVADNRYFQVQVASKRDYSLMKEIDRFLDSFEIIPF